MEKPCPHRLVDSARSAPAIKRACLETVSSFTRARHSYFAVCVCEDNSASCEKQGLRLNRFERSRRVATSAHDHSYLTSYFNIDRRHDVGQKRRTRHWAPDRHDTAADDAE